MRRNSAIYEFWLYLAAKKVSTAATAATSLIQRRFENWLHPPSCVEVALELKNYAPRSVRVESSRKLVISSHHAMFFTTAPQVDGDNNKTEDNYENYNKS